MRFLVALTPLLLAAAVPADAPRRTASNFVSVETVASKIHAINRMEIRAGRLAMRKATTPELRRFGDLLARDHERADKRLIALAGMDKIELVDRPLEGGDADVMRKLERHSGEQFDREFLHGMQQGHHAAIALLEDAKARAINRDLIGFVSRMLPILRQHEKLSTVLESTG